MSRSIWSQMFMAASGAIGWMRVSGCDGEAADEWLQGREPFHKQHRFGAERAAKLAALR